MGHRFGATLGLSSACVIVLFGASEAHAQRDLAIQGTFINESGDLELRFRDVLPIPANMLYEAYAISELTYVCADASRRPLREKRYRQTLRAAVDQSAYFTPGFMGQVQGFVTLDYPRSQETLVCPAGTSPVLASVKYSEIQLRNQLGASAGTRDIGMVFIRLPESR